MYREDIIAVIPTHYRPGYFEAALKSVLEQTVKCDVLIIDSGHHKYTKEIIEKYNNFTNKRKIIYKEIENISPANNFYEGFKTAYEMGYEWTWVMDDDAQAEKETIEELLKYISISDGILVSTVLTFYDNTISFFHRRHVKNNFIFIEYNSSLDEYNKNYFECDTVSFVSLLISKKLLNEIGFNNRDFFFQYDDTDFSIRIRLKNKKILNINESRVFHGKKSKENNKYEYSIKEIYGLRNRMYIIKKYSKNRIMANFFNTYTFIKGILSTIIRERYKGYKFERFKGIVRAYISAEREELGEIIINNRD